MISKGLFKMRYDNNIYSPVNGFCVDVCKCKDTTFSSSLIGDGFMIVPYDDLICSPCDGVLKMIFPTNHAFGVVMSDGKEVIVHIGIDTVELNGVGFISLAEVGTKVMKNDPIIKIDRKLIIRKGYDISIICIVVGSNNLEKQNINIEVTIEDVIIEGDI